MHITCGANACTTANASACPVRVPPRAASNGCPAARLARRSRLHTPPPPARTRFPAARCPLARSRWAAPEPAVTAAQDDAPKGLGKLRLGGDASEQEDLADEEAAEEEARQQEGQQKEEQAAGRRRAARRALYVVQW